MIFFFICLISNTKYIVIFFARCHFIPAHVEAVKTLAMDPSMTKSKPTQSESFGSCLLDLRRARNMSQKALSLIADMDQGYVAGIESGRRPLPKEKQLTRLICALQVSADEEQKLREAYAFSKLAYAFGEINPDRCDALVTLTKRLCHLSLKDFKRVEDLALKLEL